MSNAFHDLNISYEAMGKILKSKEMANIVNSFAHKQSSDVRNIKNFVGFDRCHSLVYKDEGK